jgi:peptidoglycan hydrolase-like protein with peptidoglycan-binding domain
MKPSCLLLLAAITAASASAVFAADSQFVDSNTVRKVQQTLSDRGFRTMVDGQMGPRTQAALKRFQRSESLEPTGQLNRQTLVALGIQKADAKASVDEHRYSPETVRAVQRTLNNRGFRAGAVDGTMNPQTQQALREFQKSENLDDSGRLNPRTLAALGVQEDHGASAGASRPVPRAAAPTIREMQHRLNARGFHVGTPDGILGPKTRAALREFQRSENLEVTGQPNPRTLAALGIKQPLAATGS